MARLGKAGSDEPLSHGQADEGQSVGAQGEGYGSESAEGKRFAGVPPGPVSPGPGPVPPGGASTSTTPPVTLDGQCLRIRWGISSLNHYLDAYTSHNGNVVTRTFEDNDTQLWCFTWYSDDTYTIQHRSFQGQFLDAYESTNDHRAVLRNAQLEDGSPDPSQLWSGPRMKRLSQLSTGRFLDGYPNTQNDYRAVTRTLQSGFSQTWVF